MADHERARPGKIGSLAVILERHYEDLEADLTYQGIALGDLWLGKLSWRKLWILVSRLPMDSFTHTAIRESMSDEEREAADKRVAGHGRWAKEHYLLAAAVDAIREGTWVVARMNGAKVEMPKPIDRPGMVKPKPRALPAGIALMQEIVANGGGIPERFVRQPPPEEVIEEV